MEPLALESFEFKSDFKSNFGLFLSFVSLSNEQWICTRNNSFKKIAILRSNDFFEIAERTTSKCWQRCVLCWNNVGKSQMILFKKMVLINVRLNWRRRLDADKITGMSSFSGSGNWETFRTVFSYLRNRKMEAFCGEENWRSVELNLRIEERYSLKGHLEMMFRISDWVFFRIEVLKLKRWCQLYGKRW